MAFTLIELLACISIVVILAALILPTAGKVRMDAARARGISNLRQVGLAVSSFAGENQGRLLGPAPLGVYPFYNRAGRNTTYVIAAQLAPYLGLPDAAALKSSETIPVPVLEDPGFKMVKKDSSSAPNFIQNPILSDEPGLVGKKHIFGIIATGNIPTTAPMTLMDIAEIGGPSKVWMLTTVDQLLPSSITNKSGWVSKLPATPAYGGFRLRVFVDGHVEAVPADSPLL